MIGIILWLILCVLSPPIGALVAFAYVILSIIGAIFGDGDIF